MKQVNLILLPFAGGGKYAYRTFADMAPASILCINVELPGRGSRFKERLLTNLHDMVNDIFLQVQDKLHQPYAIFGHSMGSILGYLLTKKIIAEKFDPPLYLFFTARGGPSSQYNNVGLYKLPRKRFVEEISTFGRGVQQIINDTKLFSLFEPLLRADFEAVENYIYEKSSPMDVPMLIGLGTQDTISLEQAETWQIETNKSIELIQFQGNHFFIFKHAASLFELFYKRISILDY